MESMFPNNSAVRQRLVNTHLIIIDERENKIGNLRDFEIDNENTRYQIYETKLKAILKRKFVDLHVCHDHVRKVDLKISDLSLYLKKLEKE